VSTPDISLKHGDRFPYDVPDSWEDGENGETLFPAQDWAHRAARGVIADLSDRRDIKRGFEQVDEEIRAEIVTSLADIIRAAFVSR
jgi:hypothetical protein